MSDFEDKLGSILNNPQMMQQILSMAQSLGASPPSSEPQHTPSTSPEIDPALLRCLSGLVQQGGVDQNQHALLDALSPYLSQRRVTKLERAMRAAKMAGMATNFLNAGGLQLIRGR